MKNSLPYKIITQVICVVLLVILVFPLYLMLEKSLAVSGFGNYAKVFEYFNLIPNVITSIIVVGGTLIVVSIVVSMAAYAFSKLEFPHKQAVYSYRYDDPYICINLSALSDRKGTSSEQYRMVIGISICHSKCLL